MMLRIEFYLVVASVAVAFSFPGMGRCLFQVAERAFARLAQRRRLAVLAVGAVALAARAAVLPIEPVPEPAIHDEFSYLLLGDTFAHGRLANPTHPMWVHFESFHIIHRPTYVSMFYPAHGLILALGQVVAGHPFWGVWLSAGLMCAAICWMLQSWVPARWALFGGFLAVMRLGVFSYWANSYYGGTVAAVGGALVLGAVPRIKRRQRVIDALLGGLGLAILANSRPFEGLFLAFPVGLALFAWALGKNGPPLRMSLRRILMPVALLLAVTGSAMLYYFWRTTGSPFRTPYLLTTSTYNPVPYFPWQSLKPMPVYNHRVMRTYYATAYFGQYPFVRSKPLVFELTKVFQFWFFFIGPVLTLPVLMLALIAPYGFSYRSIGNKTRLLLAVCLCSLVALALPIYGLLPHYAAAFTAALYALLVQAMRHLRVWRWRGRPTGRFMVRAVPTICFAMLLLRAAAPLAGLPLPPEWPRTWCSPQLGNVERARILARLKGREGRHLVVVSYRLNHDPVDEWVYNEADIDKAKVVWARDMDPARNAELLSYFRGYHVWLAEPDEWPPRLSPYPALNGQVTSEK
jgi:hypothetical protein